MKYSIIFLSDRVREHFKTYIENIHRIFRNRGDEFEMIIVANGTEQFVKNELSDIPVLPEELKVISFGRQISSSVCLKTALHESAGSVIMICGSYQQLTNESIVKMVDALDDDTDLVVPWRQNRYDPFFNRLQSKAFNALTRKITHSSLHDLSCPDKIGKRDALEAVDIYGNLFKFLPILAERKGFKVKEVACDHHEAQGETGIYRLSEYADRLIAMLTIYFNLGFSKKPLRFFSTVGIGLFITGMALLGYVFAEKILIDEPVGDRLALLVSIILMVTGVQSTSFGLLGEIVAFVYGRGRPEYSIEKKI